MRILFSILMTASLASAQSHPSWWNYASPDATALVGIQWENLRQSPLAAAIQTELSSSGSLGFPGLDCLRSARELVLSSPPLLVAEAGKFSAVMVQQQAGAAGLHRASYKDVTMWLPADVSSLGVAQISETLLLVGSRKTLEAAVHNSLLEVGRRYSPLLMKGARYSRAADLWAVSFEFPDPLASLFVPFEVDGRNFEGALSLREGLRAEASFDAMSGKEATKTAADLRKRVPRGVKVSADANRVLIDWQATEEQFLSELHAPQATPPAVPTPAIVDLAKAAPVAAAPAPNPRPAPAPALAEPPAPPRPQVIRIVGLDDGPIEIPFPAVAH